MNYGIDLCGRSLPVDYCILAFQSLEPERRAYTEQTEPQRKLQTELAD